MRAPRYACSSQRRESGLREKGPLKLPQVVKKAILGTLPTTFILVILLGYVLVILGIFNATSNLYVKVFIAIVALGIKVTGNKVLLVILNKTRPKAFVTDMTLFTYEFSTALICRILQMSIPDETTAQLMSLAAAVLEVATRNFFFVLFLKAGMNNVRRSESRIDKLERLLLRNAANVGV